MASLLSAIERILTPTLLGRLASAVGLDPKLAQGISAAAVPAILSGLARMAGEPGGADRVAGAATRASSGVLDGLAGKLGNPAELMEQGQSLMSSLFGNRATNALTSSVASYVGGSEGTTRSLLGLLTPLVLGALGREQQSSGGNGAGLARQLQTQASQFTAAMPSGVSNLLERNGFFDSLGITPEPRAAAARSAETMGTARPAAAARISEPPRSSGWAYWALPLAALLGGVIGYLLNGERPGVERPTQTASLASASPVGSYLHSPVSSQSGEQLGTVDDVLIGGDGRVVAIIVGIERALGLGEKRVALPYSSIEATKQDGSQRLVLKGSNSKETLASAPPYEKSKQ
jgi:sporulation protein YlmC with PRC-barrel domain